MVERTARVNGRTDPRQGRTDPPPPGGGTVGAAQAVRTRRPRGSLDPTTTTAVYARVSQGTKAALDAIADATGMSMGVVLEELARNVELDELGCPVWWRAHSARHHLHPGRRGG